MAGFEEQQIFKPMANLESTASFLEEPTRDTYIDEAWKKIIPTFGLRRNNYNRRETALHVAKSTLDLDLVTLLEQMQDRLVKYSFEEWARDEHIDEAGKERIHTVGCDVDNARSNLMFWGRVVPKQGESYFKELADKQEKMPNFKSYGSVIGSSLPRLKAADCGEKFGPDKRKKTLDYTKVALDSSGKMISQLFDLNMYDGETLSMRKRKNIVQRLSSFLIAAIVLYWIISDTCSQLSVLQLQLGRGWSSLLKLLGFTVFVCAITAMIVVGAPFSRLQRTMLMFWAILMLIRSAMSRTALYVSILGILLTGWHGLLEKQPPLHG